MRNIIQKTVIYCLLSIVGYLLIANTYQIIKFNTYKIEQESRLGDHALEMINNIDINTKKLEREYNRYLEKYDKELLDRSIKYFNDSLEIYRNDEFFSADFIGRKLSLKEFYLLYDKSKISKIETVSIYKKILNEDEHQFLSALLTYQVHCETYMDSILFNYEYRIDFVEDMKILYKVQFQQLLNMLSMQLELLNDMSNRIVNIDLEENEGGDLNEQIVKSN